MSAYLEILSVKRQYDSVKLAARLAKEQSLDIGVIQKLNAEKQAINKTRLNLEKKILKQMSKDGEYIQKVEDNWYAIRYYNDKKDVLMIETLLGAKIPFVSESHFTEHPLSRLELESLLPVILDKSTLDNYRYEIRLNAVSLLKQISGVDITDSVNLQDIPCIEGVAFTDVLLGTTVESTEPPSIQGIIVKYHSAKRYAERVLGIKGEYEISKYLKSNLEYVTNEILTRLESSAVIWEQDGIQYLLDYDNLIYIKGLDDEGKEAIITLYEDDWGFSKQINRSIIYQQIELMHSLRQELYEYEDNLNPDLEKYDNTISCFDSEISLLQAQIEDLIMRKEQTIAEKQNLVRGHNILKSRLNVETQKLFRFNG